METNNVPVQKGIKRGISLIAFAAEHGPKVALAPLTNKATGEQFTSVAFTDNAGEVTFVKFSSNLGELTAREISAMKDELQVVTLDSDSRFPYVLCKKGESTWEEISL